MSTFRSIEELVKSLDREKELLKEMFAKRKSLSFRYDYALEMTEYKEERIRYLIDYGDVQNIKRFDKNIPFRVCISAEDDIINVTLIKQIIVI